MLITNSIFPIVSLSVFYQDVFFFPQTRLLFFFLHLHLQSTNNVLSTGKITVGSTAVPSSVCFAVVGETFLLNILALLDWHPIVLNPDLL